MSAPLPLLAIPGELADLTGRPASDVKLLASLKEASRRFRSAVHHRVSYSATSTDSELEGSGADVLLLPHFPISVVSAVTLNGTALPADGSDWRPIRPSGMVRRLSGRVWPQKQLLVVTYTHGYSCVVTPAHGAPGDDDYVPAFMADIPPVTASGTPGDDGYVPAVPMIPALPEDIQGAVLGLSQVLMNMEPGIQSRTVLGDTVSFGRWATVGETQEWSDAVGNYKLRSGS